MIMSLAEIPQVPKGMYTRLQCWYIVVGTYPGKNVGDKCSVRVYSTKVEGSTILRTIISWSSKINMEQTGNGVR